MIPLKVRQTCNIYKNSEICAQLHSKTRYLCDRRETTMRHLCEFSWNTENRLKI